ncbi:penicillin-binding protein 1C [Paucibacter sp. Y2R2-4]|uniref:penicillin-binding protein 1C n=1 Tax=Paucibacter sp. Y2R2-4 TaxID=2893553 RepID=UPI0021E3C7D6|nr:penicillin-binding protein 1C [Paucibacter sp. Y2R2-4]MCV2349553.1 penicillin-binding protein 1C [Paucibacter sp. Y2R2-4]
MRSKRRRGGFVSSALALALSLTLAWAAPAQAQLPSYSELRAAHRVSDFILLDRRGEPLQTLRLDHSRRALEWVGLEQVSLQLLHALLLGEDRRFYEHSGVDWSAAASSAWANLWNRRTRGASTITMQLAGLIDADLSRPSGGRSVGQKLGQAALALRLERTWSKAQILEAYLNLVPLRGELLGLNALSQTLLGKHPDGLSAEESVLVAAMVRSPNASAVQLGQRACGLLQQMKAPLKSSSCEPLIGQAQALLAQRPGRALGESWAPHFARQVLRSDGPARQRSSLDAGLQRLAVSLLKTQLAELSGRNVEDGAVLVLDNATGAVLAWVGSSGSLSAAAEVDGVLARRQPGSTLKPFVYAQAIEKRLITAASLLDDSPAQISTPAGLYLPQNYDKEFKGYVSARSALGNSLNVPAVRLTAMLGADPVFERFNALGLALPHTSGFYGLSLALGSSDLSLLALSNAYRTLANGGVYQALDLKDRGKQDSRRVIDARAAFIVSDILADNNARARSFGLDSVLATRGFAAVKTGTSKDMRDNWCMGYSSRYTVGVWVGNASGEAMHGVSGISGAAPIWAGLMRYLHQDLVSTPPVAPPGLLAQRVEYPDQREPARQEWFIKGTEQTRLLASAQMQDKTVLQGISSPRDGSIFALDPDMPPQAQRIRFEGESGLWVLDDKPLGRGKRYSWAPWPGRHQLQLMDERGQLKQAVSFEVRGASLKSAAKPASARAAAP